MPATLPTRYSPAAQQAPRATLMSMHCPACGTAARIRNSRPASDTVRELYLECTNPACRCIFQAIAEATKVFAPSMLPEAEQTAASRGLRRGKNAGSPSPAKHDPRQHSLPLHPPDAPGA